MEHVFFYLMCFFLTASGIGVVVSKNAIYSALFLTFNLLLVAGIYAMLGAHFLAVAQIIVYAGAIMVLVIFVIMLLNLKEESGERSAGNMTYWFFAAATGVAFLLVIAPLLHEQFSYFIYPSEGIEGNVQEFGKLLFVKYLFAFEFSAILLTAAVVGAVMLAKRRREK